MYRVYGILHGIYPMNDIYPIDDLYPINGVLHGICPINDIYHIHCILNGLYPINGILHGIYLIHSIYPINNIYFQCKYLFEVACVKIYQKVHFFILNLLCQIKYREHYSLRFFVLFKNI